jgi:hypothetical protein
MQKRQPQKDTHGEKIKEGEIIIKQEKQDADMVIRQRRTQQRTNGRWNLGERRRERERKADR